MLKQILMIAALLVPSAAFAADQTPADPVDGTEKTICEAIGTDQFRCAQAFAICHWDPVDVRCEHNGGSRCDQYHDQNGCNANNCVWDKEDPLGPRCEALG